MSFSCVSSERGPQPMGIAFVNLPQCVRPAVIIKQGPDDVDVTWNTTVDQNVSTEMDHIVGPVDQFTEIITLQKNLSVNRICG